MTLSRQEHLLRKALTLLKNEAAFPRQDLLAYLHRTQSVEMVQFQKWEALCLALPLVSPAGDLYASTRAARAFVLVFEGEQIIADFSAFTADARIYMEDTGFFELCQKESAWMALEYRTAWDLWYHDFPYPWCLEKEEQMTSAVYDPDAILVFVRSTYVSKAWRRQGIFRQMLDAHRDFILRYRQENTDIQMLMSLDPDVPTLGPDARREPYIYDYQRDEPLRQRNTIIARKLGFGILEYACRPEEIGDGTLRRFAARMEHVILVRGPEGQFPA